MSLSPRDHSLHQGHSWWCAFWGLGRRIMTRIYQYSVIEWFHCPKIPCACSSSLPPHTWPLHTHSHTTHTDTRRHIHTDTLIYTHTYTCSHTHSQAHSYTAVTLSHTPGDLKLSSVLSATPPVLGPERWGLLWSPLRWRAGCPKGQGPWVGLCWELLARVSGVAQNNSEMDRHSGERWPWRRCRESRGTHKKPKSALRDATSCCDARVHRFCYNASCLALSCRKDTWTLHLSPWSSTQKRGHWAMFPILGKPGWCCQTMVAGGIICYGAWDVPVPPGNAFQVRRQGVWLLLPSDRSHGAQGYNRQPQVHSVAAAGCDHRSVPPPCRTPCWQRQSEKP